MTGVSQHHQLLKTPVALQENPNPEFQARNADILAESVETVLVLIQVARPALLMSRDSSRERGSSAHLSTARCDEKKQTGNEEKIAKEYYFGEDQNLKDILVAEVNGTSDDALECNNSNPINNISPHIGEVVRIRVPYIKHESSGGQYLSSDNIQRLVDQTISPSFNGHKVTIKVNTSSEAISSSVDRRTRRNINNSLQRKVSSSGDLAAPSGYLHDLPGRTSSAYQLGVGNGGDKFL